MRRRGDLVALGTLVALLATSSPAPAYVPNTLDFIGGQPVVAHWDAGSFPIPFHVTPGLTNDISDASDRAALDSAMATWSGVDDSIAGLLVAGERAVEANVLDGINAIEFSNSADLESAFFTTLTFLSTDADGALLEVDVLVNDRGAGFTTTAGSSVGLDLETVMLQELGRVLGLASSPLGGFDADQTLSEDSAVMYPFGRGIGESARTLRDDDVAGLVSMYPAGSSRRASILGSVSRSGAPVFGAHVVAYDPLSGVLVGAVSLPDGSFRIDGLPAGRYFLEAVPLTGRVTAAALGGIFATGDVDADFTRGFLDQTVRVGAGEVVSGASLEVQ